MFTVTDALKAYLVAKGWAKAGDDDATFRKAAEARLLSGDLSPKKFKKLSAPAGSTPNADALATIKGIVVDVVGGELKEIKALLSQRPAPAAAPAPAPAPAPTPEPAPAANKETDLAERISQMVELKVKELTGSSPSPAGVLAKAAGSLGSADNVRVKGAVESYSHSRKDCFHAERTKLGTPNPLAGQRASHAGINLYHPSDRDLAISAAYFKWAISRYSSTYEIPRYLRMTDHDRDLVAYALHESQWTGIINGQCAEDDGAIAVKRRKLTEFERKALLDDSTSGGIEITPIEFDDALITTPILYGELYPLVEVQNITRGRRIKGGTVANPTISWGVAEGAAIQAFSTSAFVGPFDTTIFPVSGAMELGLDFEEDSPTNIGQIIVKKYGEVFMAEYDRVVAVGDGVTQPLGVLNSAGTTSVSADNQGNGPPTVSDYEGLLFGVAKQFRLDKGGRTVFAGSEQSYRRVRGIAVGPSDERRVFGMTHADYMVLDRPFKIQNNIANNQIFFCNMGGVRYYRRLGLNIRVETQGNYLALKNLKLIVVRARLGGQLTLGGYAAVSTNAQN